MGLIATVNYIDNIGRKSFAAQSENAGNARASDIEWEGCRHCSARGHSDIR